MDHVTKAKSSRSRPSILQAMHEIAGYALIGSVVAGALFGWFETPVEPRAIGAGVGAVLGLFIQRRLS